jgi:hypothetical protein
MIMKGANMTTSKLVNGLWKFANTILQSAAVPEIYNLPLRFVRKCRKFSQNILAKVYLSD